ncbi:hypothetical protein [Embleya sp. NPDC059237]|uniref:hypothetical protein n=1 Tax=Embleya sp. NPDC059237 TaxID=3346784 RepID=UPI0036CB32D3
MCGEAGRCPSCRRHDQVSSPIRCAVPFVTSMSLATGVPTHSPENPGVSGATGMVEVDRGPTVAERRSCTAAPAAFTKASSDTSGSTNAVPSSGASTGFVTAPMADSNEANSVKRSRWRDRSRFTTDANDVPSSKSFLFALTKYTSSREFRCRKSTTVSQIATSRAPPLAFSSGLAGLSQ